LADIYTLTSKGVFTFVLPILRDYQLAEDVMQDTYVSCYDNIKSYQLGTSARNWLLTIAKNSALSQLKKRNREISFDFSEDNHPDGVYFLGDVDSPTITLANKVLAEDEFNIVMMYADRRIQTQRDRRVPSYAFRHGDVEIRQRFQEAQESDRRQQNGI
jgi:RNA polymerase sigma-70 factor (ECF subfamily)